MGPERKTNRVFIGLPLNGKQMISHVQLSQFRAKLAFPQMINLTAYMLHLFPKSGISGYRIIHCIDSIELTADNQELLASIGINGNKNRKLR